MSSIYLDNSATTIYKPKIVIKAVEEALTNYSANPGRGGHRESIKAGMKVYETREKVARFVGESNPLNVIFGYNCTECLNMAIFGTAKHGHVICTENEHNSVLRPLEKLANDGLISYSVVKQPKNRAISRSDIEPHLRPDTYLIICNHVSNVNGDMCDVQSIGSLAREKHLLFLVDMAQSCGHLKMDMEKFGVSMVALAGHKGLYAMQGIGVLVISNGIVLSPLIFGGTGTNSEELIQPVNSPERYESGTLSVPAIMSLSAGIDFVLENGDFIKHKIDDLQTYLHYELSKLPLEIYTNPDNTNGVFAFNFNEYNSDEVANYLSEKHGICVRSGLHCAPLKHKALGTLEKGAIRVSLGINNTFSDLEHFVSCIKHINKHGSL